MPWRNVERYTFGRVEPVPSPLVVPYAEPFQLNVKLAADTLYSPETGKARIGNQPAVRVPLAAGTYPLAFPPQKKDAPLEASLRARIFDRFFEKVNALGDRRVLPGLQETRPVAAQAVHDGDLFEGTDECAYAGGA